MSTTYWAMAVDTVRDGRSLRDGRSERLYFGATPTMPSWDEWGPAKRRHRFDSAAHARKYCELAKVVLPVQLVMLKVTRYTAAESRSRAEARGEVCALKALYVSSCPLSAKAAKYVHAMLTDARRRAGVGK